MIKQFGRSWPRDRAMGAVARLASGCRDTARHEAKSPAPRGKIERWHKSLKQECIRPLTPLTVDGGRCAPLDSTLRRSLQRHTTAQRHWLCGAAGSARRTASRDPRGSRSQVRSRQTATSESPPASCVKSEVASGPRCRIVVKWISSGLPDHPPSGSDAAIRYVVQSSDRL
jgi:hypothetical protein